MKTSNKHQSLDFLKSFSKETLKNTHRDSDQAKKISKPKTYKPYKKNQQDIVLPPPAKISPRISLDQAIQQRKSHRQFTTKPLTIQELSYLLWATQGVKGKAQHRGSPVVLRPIPTPGGFNPFETYVFLRRVKNVPVGLYRYIPNKHLLHFVYQEDELFDKIKYACLNQSSTITSAVVFIWTVIPYRVTWRYGEKFGAKSIAIAAGHLCQNLYLTAEEVNCGTCAIGAYFQEEIDTIIRVDGKDEFVIYVAPLGKIS